MIAIFHEWGYESRLVEQEYLYNRLTLARRYESGARQTFRTSLAARMYHPTDAEQCLRLYTLWALRRQAAVSDLQARAMLRDGFYVHRRWLEGASALGIRGFVVEAAGEIQGYTLGVDLSAEVFVIIAEVTNVEFQGVASRLTWELCRVVDQPWINGMGDAGLETLARAKAADCPQRVLPVYAVTPRLPGPAVRSGSKSRAGERGGC